MLWQKMYCSGNRAWKIWNNYSIWNSCQKSAALLWIDLLFANFFLCLFERRKNRIQFTSIWNEIWCFCFEYFQCECANAAMYLWKIGIDNNEIETIINKQRQNIWKKKRRQHNLLMDRIIGILMKSNDCVSPPMCYAATTIVSIFERNVGIDKCHKHFWNVICHDRVYLINIL